MRANRYVCAAAVLLTLLLIPLISVSQNLTGEIISVADGDTITILTQGQRQMKIRLYGIGTPEGGHDFGNKAKKFTSSQVYGKQVEVIPYNIDKYGRTVGVVLADGVNVNKEIIRDVKADLLYVKEQLGHSSIKVTVDIYGHLLPGKIKNPVDFLDGLITKSTPYVHPETKKALND